MRLSVHSIHVSDQFDFNPNTRKVKALVTVEKRNRETISFSVCVLAKEDYLSTFFHNPVSSTDEQKKILNERIFTVLTEELPLALFAERSARYSNWAWKEIHSEMTNSHALVLDEYPLASGSLKSLLRFHGSHLETLTLSVYGGMLDDNQLLELLAYCPNLKNLNLKGCPKITDKSILNEKGVGSLKSLEYLNLSGTAITDEAIIDRDHGITRLDKMQYLNLSGTAITDEAIIDADRGIAQLDEMRLLELSRCANLTFQAFISPDGLGELILRRGKAFRLSYVCPDDDFVLNYFKLLNHSFREGAVARTKYMKFCEKFGNQDDESNEHFRTFAQRVSSLKGIQFSFWAVKMIGYFIDPIVETDMVAEFCDSNRLSTPKEYAQLRKILLQMLPCELAILAFDKPELVTRIEHVCGEGKMKRAISSLPVNDFVKKIGRLSIFSQIKPYAVYATIPQKTAFIEETIENVFFDESYKILLSETNRIIEHLQKATKPIPKRSYRKLLREVQEEIRQNAEKTQEIISADP
ncbi:MAG: hypothetical protein KDK72_08895, partial [Chlamydiia bacterium]|nr:hypothetical protein [Chlamydiia bacterium]